MTQEHLRVWSRLQLVQQQLCFHPTNKALLVEEKALRERLLELERKDAA